MDQLASLFESLSSKLTDQVCVQVTTQIQDLENKLQAKAVREPPLKLEQTVRKSEIVEEMLTVEDNEEKEAGHDTQVDQGTEMSKNKKAKKCAVRYNRATEDGRGESFL